MSKIPFALTAATTASAAPGENLLSFTLKAHFELSSRRQASAQSFITLTAFDREATTDQSPYCLRFSTSHGLLLRSM